VGANLKTAMKFFGTLCRAKAYKFWGHPATQANANRQMTELVESFSKPAERAILETVISDPDQPVRIIRNGDIGREPAERINVNMIGNMALLKYLAHCPDGIEKSDVGTHRYVCESPGPDRPYGFSFDDLARGVIACYACFKQRERSDHVETKKAVLDGKKLPAHGDEVVTSYAKAGKVHYGRFMAEDDPDHGIPENLAQQAVFAMAQNSLRLQQELEEQRQRDIAAGRPVADPAEMQNLTGQLWRRTAYMFRMGKYDSISDAAKGKMRSGRHRQTVDAMEQLPPIDYKTVASVIDELYARGLFKRPEVTGPEDGDILEKFRPLLPDAWSIEQYIAQMERDGEVLDRAIEEGTLPEDGRKAAEEYRENLKQCHAILALIPARLPVEMTYTEALEKLGMLREDLEGDARYTDTRIDRRDTAEGRPVNPNGYSLKPGQVVGK
jgi:hypothetical protein